MLVPGSDACAHLAEEVSDAKRNVPRAMVYSVIINAVLAFIFSVVTLYCVTDIVEVMNAQLPMQEIVSSTH